MKIMGNSKLELNIKILTYNHENYICKCIDSIKKQNVNFEYDITIFDDCSSDKTVEVIKSVYGDEIRIFEHESNRGIGVNNYEASIYGDAEYQMVFAGDDWLIGENNIQLLHDFLKSHRDYASVGWWTRVYDDYGNVISEVKPAWRSFELLDWSVGMDVRTDPGMTRNIFSSKESRWLMNINPESDEPQFWFYILSKGKCGIVPEFMRGYRFHNDEKLDNYNSKHTYLDTYLLYRRTFYLIENKFKVKGFFSYKITLLNYRLLSYAIKKFWRDKGIKSFFSALRLMKPIELLKIFIYFPYIYLNGGEYTTHFIEMKKKRLRLLKDSALL